MIDQLGAGALFGEIAMLAGGRRSASIRTAVPSILVRIRRAALRARMAANASIEEAIWGAFAARVFEDHLRVSGGAPALDRAERAAWIRSGRHEELAPAAPADGAGDAFLLVLSGAVVVEQDGSTMSAQAPIVLEGGARAGLRAKTAARVVHVPAR
jgi:hypothetical protein